MGSKSALTRLAQLLFVVACAVAPAAHAQGEGPGVAAGGVLLHPHLQLDIGFDSNVFSESSDEAVNGGVLARIYPHLIVETPRPRVVDLDANVGARWRQYLTGADEGVTDQSGLDVLADLGIRFNASGIVSVRPSNSLRRVNDPAFNDAGEPYGSLSNEVRLELGFHPGGARRTDRLGFSGRIGGVQRIWRYDNQPSLDRSSLGGFLDIRYNFLPKTAVFVSSSVATLTYEGPFTLPAGSDVLDDVAALGALALPNSDALPLRAVAGLSGLLTRRLSVRAQVGYGATNHKSGDSFGSVVAAAGFTVDATARTRLGLAYSRDFDVSSFGNFFAYHRAEIFGEAGVSLLRVTGRVFGQLNSYGDLANPEVTVVSGGSGITFTPILIDGAPANPAQRDDTLVGGSLTVGFDLTDWFYTGLSYRMDLRSSNYAVVSASDPTAIPASPDYLRHQAFLTLDFHY